MSIWSDSVWCDVYCLDSELIGLLPIHFQLVWFELDDCIQFALTCGDMIWLNWIGSNAMQFNLIWCDIISYLSYVWYHLIWLSSVLSDSSWFYSVSLDLSWANVIWIDFISCNGVKVLSIPIILRVFHLIDLTWSA